MSGSDLPPLPKLPRHPSTLSLSHEHILDALHRSPDNGATLDLAHRRLADIPDTAADDLVTLGTARSPESKSAPLARIALGHNRLATLPIAFSLLTRLRYLNLKSNNFATFPDVLTLLPSLEVLDISRNKIRRFPTQPGSLTNLRVFSLSKNKITKLPAYFVEFRKLQIFKIDQNAVDWPSRHIMEPEINLEDPRCMGDWIKTVQTWIRDNLDPSSRRPSEDFNSSDSKQTPMQTTLPISDPSIASHSRSISAESDISTYSAIEASLQWADAAATPSKVLKHERPPRLNLGPLSDYNSGFSSQSPLNSPGTYLPTPDDSVSSAEEDTAKGHPSMQQQQQHIRNASYAGADPKRPPLSSKKSLPDLRIAKSPLLRNEVSFQFQAPSPNDMLRDSNSKTPIGRDKSHVNECSNSQKATNFESPRNSPTFMDRNATAPPIDVERNSYFRRLSTLPSSTISKAIPYSLLTLVDAARGILFAVSQVYQILQHYTVYAIDERLSAVLLKVLDPSSIYMIQLINALDRFDVTSRRTLPSPTICRAIVESCKDTVSMFGKTMGVLALQLKVLTSRDDVRYTRQMLLVLYGATAEISNAWQTITPHIAEVEPLLRERPPPASSKHQRAPSFGLRTQGSPSTIHSIPLLTPSVPPSPRPIWRSHSSQPAIESDRSRMMRRHAGSFSSKDVQIGKMLPSTIEPPHSGGIVLPSSARAPTPRSIFRQPNGTAAVNGIAHPFGLSWSSHSRQGSQSSLLASSSTSSSPSTPAPFTPSKAASHEVPTSSTLVDNEAMDAMQVAVEAAPAVWELMDTIAGDIEDSQIDVFNILINAKALTRRLSNNIRAVKGADPAGNRKTLRDDATVFAKTVISLCNVVKTHGIANPLPPTLRTNMINLMNATEESVMLLHVSSFPPSRPYSPVVNTFANLSAIVEDGKLGSSLTRSRSALDRGSAPLVTPVLEMPRTALPSQGFKVMPIPRKDGGDSNEVHL